MMRTILKIALFLEIASGVFWTFSLAMIKAPGLEVLGLFVLVYAIQAICFVVGFWAYWRAAELRRMAGWVLALPFMFLFLPGIVRSLAGGHLTESGLAALLLITASVVLIACLVVPRKVAGKLPGFLFRSRVLNSLMLLGPLLGWLFLAGVLVWVFGVEGEQTARNMRRDATGYGLASMIVIAAIYLGWLGVASLLSGTWAWMGLHSGVERACRKLNVAQIAVATPGLLIGGFALFFLTSQS